MQYHIVGIAGSGMSGIAHMLLDQGHQVSGSDLASNAATAALERRGARTVIGHRPEHLGEAEVVLATSAARDDHVELEAARARGIPVLRRADLWRQWSQERDVVAVAGTHGKTTTTAMLALALERAGLDPGFLIGAEVPDLGGSARWGSGPLVIEADEYDNTFLALTPQIAIVTNVDWDHVDCFPTSDEYAAAFARFASQVQAALVYCADDPGAQALAANASLAMTQSYGTGRGAQWRIVEEEDADGTPRWTLISPLGHEAPLALALPGAHNRLNAAAATVACGFLGLAPEGALSLIGSYQGAARRFELRGEVGGVTVIDDYAHHPAEVRATLAAARERFAGRRIIVYVQPHTYSRSATFLEAWGDAFLDADLVLVGDIYGAREENVGALSAATVAARIRRPEARAVGGLADAARAILALVRPGDLLLTMGAGDGWKVGELVLDVLRTA
jgi:UDP-N-acetylmuramate--alanine ligase